jgi:hypothetical protein
MEIIMRIFRKGNAGEPAAELTSLQQNRSQNLKLLNSLVNQTQFPGLTMNIGDSFMPNEWRTTIQNEIFSMPALPHQFRCEINDTIDSVL